ncbi:hypothetical protein [Streptomyces sp. NPDC048002]|uniref:hypothetical protein n=1 Tax=Streptomyces sp. NPDC048002 TaxID=3154344 RepID=UPI00340B4992
MSRWSSVIPGRRRRPGPGQDRTLSGGASGASGASGGRAGPPVEDVDGVLLVRSVEDDSFPLDAVAEVAGAVGNDADVVTVIVGTAAGGAAPDADHWARLGALLDSLRERGTDRIRLVMSGAGADRPDRPCVARRIAEAWELEVTAPDGAVLVTPGGALFVHGDSGPMCGWWRFAPGAEPRRLGRRAPVPVWEEALDGVPVRTSGGCVVDRVPAGVVIRPAEAPGPALDDLCFSVPVDFERLTVLVGAPQAEDVAADEVAAVLAGLPEAERARARLAPGGRRDLLRLGQSVAELLGSEVEVLTGLPLLDDHAAPGTAPRPTLVGRDGRPSWRPFLSSVVCAPTAGDGHTPAPRPVSPHPPEWILSGTEPGTVRLTDRWQATVTRAGLALWAPDGPRPAVAGPAVDPDVCAIELGAPGQPLDGSLLPALSQLLRGLGADVRARTTLMVRGRLLGGDGALRRLAAEHGVPGIRYVTTGRSGPAGATANRAATPAGSGGAAPHRPGVPHRSGTATVGGPDAGAPNEGVPGGTSVPDAPIPGRAGSSGTGRPVRVASGAAQAAPGVEGRAPEHPDRPDGSIEANVLPAGPVGRRPVPAVSSEPLPSGSPATETAEAPDVTVASEATASGAPLPTVPQRTASASVAAARPPGAVAPPDTESVSEPATGRSGPTEPRGPVHEPTPSPEPKPEPAPESKPAPALARAAQPPSPQEPAPAPPSAKEPAPEAPAPRARTREAPLSTREAQPSTRENPPREEPPRQAPPRPPAVLPFAPGHVSSAAERAAFRDASAGAWEGHAAAVSRVLTRLPALRGHELEVARTDLVAAHAYLTAEEGPLHHRELIRDLHTGEGRLMPYAGCLASALRRLPSYRGVALRGGAVGGPDPVTGSLLQDPAPVSALAGTPPLPTGASVRYAIWSVTGRNVRQLHGNGAPGTYEEIVFVPGTGFRVLGVRDVPGASSVVLLRELPGNATAYMDGSEELSGLDLKALANLEQALAQGLRAGAAREWPERCSGPLGQDGPPTGAAPHAAPDHPSPHSPHAQGE